MAYFQINDSLFEDITSDTHGAGLSLSRDRGTVALSRDSFIRCVAPVEGGGFYADVEKFSASCLLLSECNAANQGAAFHITSKCQNCSVSSSSASKSIGFDEDGILIYGSKSNLFEHSNISHFQGNIIALTIWPYQESMGTLRNLNAANNTIGQGIFYLINLLSIASCNILDCRSGAFIYFNPPGQFLSLSDTVFVGNLFDGLSTQDIPQKTFKNNFFDNEKTQSLFVDSQGNLPGIIMSNIITQEILIYCEKSNFCTKRSYAVLQITVCLHFLLV